MSKSVIKTYRESLAKTKKRFIGFGRKKAIVEARSELKILYKQLKDELDDDYAALIAEGLAEIDINQLEYKSAALWQKKSAEDLLIKRNDEAERCLALEQYNKCVQNLIKGKCEQIASAVLFTAVARLLDGTSQPYINQYIHDPKLHKAAPVQIVQFINTAAKLRNDESSARILLKAACYLTDYPDTAKSYINRAMKISNSTDVRIANLLLSIKYDGYKPVDPIDFDDNKEETEFEMLIESIKHWRIEPDQENVLIQLLIDLSKHISQKEVEVFLIEVIVHLLEKATTTELQL